VQWVLGNALPRDHPHVTMVAFEALGYAAPWVALNPAVLESLLGFIIPALSHAQLANEAATCFNRVAVKAAAVLAGSADGLVALINAVSSDEILAQGPGVRKRLVEGLARSVVQVKDVDGMSAATVALVGPTGRRIAELAQHLAAGSAAALQQDQDFVASVAGELATARARPFPVIQFPPVILR
jgi:hypothetical protein